MSSSAMKNPMHMAAKANSFVFTERWSGENSELAGELLDALIARLVGRSAEGVGARLEPRFVSGSVAGLNAGLATAGVAPNASAPSPLATAFTANQLPARVHPHPHSRTAPVAACRVL